MKKVNRPLTCPCFRIAYSGRFLVRFFCESLRMSFGQRLPSVVLGLEGLTTRSG